MAHRDEQRLLLEALRNIPVEQQVLLELHYWESFTTDEMAAVLGIPVGTVRGRLRRARELLEQAMARVAESPALLESTRDQLDDWVKDCRRHLGDFFLPSNLLILVTWRTRESSARDRGKPIEPSMYFSADDIHDETGCTG
jgi:hypothetical protein